MLLSRAIMLLIGANMFNCAHIYLAAIVLKSIHNLPRLSMYV